MDIFLRRIPANTKHIEISEFIAPALSNGLFKRPYRILNIEIMALRDIRFDTVEYHGLVTLDSKKAARQAITRLKKRRLNGRHILVRPFYHRSWDNDPRRQASNPDDELGFIEKRQGDRRRVKYLEVVKKATGNSYHDSQAYDGYSQERVQATFNVSASVEWKFADFLLQFEQEKTAIAKESNNVDDYRITRFLTEMEGPDRNSKCFQIFATRPVLSMLLENINLEFSGTDIHYWVAPINEFGVI